VSTDGDAFFFWILVSVHINAKLRHLVLSKFGPIFQVEKYQPASVQQDQRVDGGFGCVQQTWLVSDSVNVVTNCWLRNPKLFAVKFCILFGAA
jgi:hypothetical protein